MVHIAIPYYSGSGHTARLAEHVAEGIRSVENVSAILINVETVSLEDWEILEKAQGIVFGAPTYMGSIAAPFKTFMDETSAFWADQKWADKIAAGFTVATYPSGDKLSTLSQMAVFAAQHGMVWVGQDHVGSVVAGDDLNRDGAWLGLMATSSRDKTILIEDEDARTAFLFGKRVGTATVRWFGGI